MGRSRLRSAVSSVACAVAVLVPGVVAVSAAGVVAAPVAAAVAGPVPGDVAHPIGRAHLEDFEWFNILQVVDASNRVVRSIKIAGNPLVRKPPVCYTAGRVRVNWDYSLTWKLNWFTRMCASRGVGTHDVPINRYSGRRSMDAADLGKPPFHGGPLSHGCLRMAAADAKFVYDHYSDGVPVYFVETPYRPYAARAPSAPVSVRVTPGDRSVRVTWGAAAVHGSAVSSYVVVLAPGARRLVVGPTVRSVTLSGLTNGVAYSARVSATSSRGPSPPSSASAAAVPFGLPGAPGALRALPGPYGSLVLRWGAATPNGRPVAYRLAVGSAAPVTVPATFGPYVLRGLPRGVALHLELVAVNAAGAGPAAVLDLPALR